MQVRFTGLDPAPFRDLYGLADDALAARGAVRVVADARPGYPCRITLRDADPGETVLLLPFEHLAGTTPYRASGPIFVREGATERYDAPITPHDMRSRLFSLRAYDGDGMMIDADVSEGTDLDAAFERFFARPATAFLHLHHARRGCFACRVDRA